MIIKEIKAITRFCLNKAIGDKGVTSYKLSPGYRGFKFQAQDFRVLSSASYIAKCVANTYIKLRSHSLLACMCGSTIVRILWWSNKFVSIAIAIAVAIWPSYNTVRLLFYYRKMSMQQEY